MSMTALTSAATRPPETLAARARAALGALADAPWDVLGDDDLLASALDLVAARSALRAAEARALVEIDRRDLARRSLGWGSTADWLTHVAGLRVSQGRQAVAHAHELVGDRAATLAALVAGTVSPEQAALVIDAVEELPAETALRTRAETSLLEKADHLHATDLARAAVRVVDEVDPGRAARERERQRDRLARASHRRRFLSISDDGAGGVRVRGRGSAEDAAVLRQALLPLSAPAPSVDPQTGERLSDPRDHGARTWDALVQVAQHALDTDAVPGSHGERARVSVTIPWEQLRDAAGATRGGETDDGLTLSAGTVRRMACDATVIPAVLGSESAVLDLGREARVVSASLWRALVARDTHCAFPGCGRPPVMCHAHHVEHWADGGPTALGNLALLCGHHHRTIHDTPWQVRTGSDGRPEFLPPTGLSETGSRASSTSGDGPGPHDASEDRSSAHATPSSWGRTRRRAAGARPDPEPPHDED
ncbi:HNH endonuclease signature motif containing protein [Nocardioides sp. P86]|uniref:HNH endonuclease signature motif containing protein n=1 Tax=Nocardioides sp. P86 TaxID=2939569 RepID=UPI00203E5FCF|nr:HNH endonuclease signature motif containing protein [Nocardioides sp. P86]MCM3515433.1 HNH endonuclease [Nocardioides sp. P86]